MNIFEKITELQSKGISFVLTTIIKSSGSTPGKVGFKLICTKNGEISGTVGGGQLEKEIINECKVRFEQKESLTKEYLLSENNVRSEDVKVLNMSCNGKVSVFFEYFSSPDKIYVFGGGHIGQAFLKVIKDLDYSTILIDGRKEFANAEKNPFADEIINEDYSAYLKLFTPYENSYIVIATHTHDNDYAVLKSCIENYQKIKYIGIVASKSKAKSFKEKLAGDFGDNINLQKVHMPVGLNIGGSTPAEIALSIASEIQLVRYGKEIRIKQK